MEWERLATPLLMARIFRRQITARTVATCTFLGCTSALSPKMTTTNKADAMSFEYSVIPAPTRGEKAKDAKTPGSRYALALTSELNRMAREGWEYVRADVLPSEERSGLTGRSTVYHNLLVFRRPLAASAADTALRQPQPEYAVAASPMREPQPVPDLPRAAAPQPGDLPIGTPAVPPAADTEATPPAPRTAPLQP